MSATRAARALGQLAGFLLNDAALECASLRRARPPLPNAIGSCWPVIAVRDPAWKNLLLPAFVLPLQWRGAGVHDQRLPPEVLRCAEAVLRDFGADSAEGASVAFAAGQQAWPDLSRFSSKFIEAESCYASLALGLEGLRGNIAPSGRVWASAEWKGAFERVTMLDEKLAAARIWGARHFFVAPDQKPPVDKSLLDSIELKHLGQSPQSKPREAMSKCLAEAFLEPSADDWEACQHYHAVIRTLDPVVATSFYDRVLFKHITRRCRATVRVSPGVPRPLCPTHLITIATRSTQPIRVIAGALGVKHVLVLYTEGPSNLEKEAADACRQIQSALPDCDATPQPFTYDPTSGEFPRDFVLSLRNAVRAFLGNTSADRVAFDIDRGLTLHKVALLKFLIESDNLVVSLYHEMERGNQIRHGTELILLWRASDNWSQPLERRTVAEQANDARLSLGVSKR